MPPEWTRPRPTCRSDAAGIIELWRTGCRTVQLVDTVEAGTYAAMGSRELLNVKIVQVIDVQYRARLDEGARGGVHVDAIRSTAGDRTRR